MEKIDNLKMPSLCIVEDRIGELRKIMADRYPNTPTGVAHMVTDFCFDNLVLGFPGGDAMQRTQTDDRGNHYSVVPFVDNQGRWRPTVVIGREYNGDLHDYRSFEVVVGPEVGDSNVALRQAGEIAEAIADGRTRQSLINITVIGGQAHMYYDGREMSFTGKSDFLYNWGDLLGLKPDYLTSGTDPNQFIKETLGADTVIPIPRMARMLPRETS